MQHAPHYAADQFPGDLLASLRNGLVTALLLGLLGWCLGRLYFRRNYPHHPELLPYAAVLGVMDGALLGLAAAIVTFACRVWKRERDERKRSDALLRLALEELAENRERPESP